MDLFISPICNVKFSVLGNCLGLPWINLVSYCFFSLMCSRSGNHVWVSSFATWVDSHCFGACGSMLRVACGLEWMSLWLSLVLVSAGCVTLGKASSVSEIIPASANGQRWTRWSWFFLLLLNILVTRILSFSLLPCFHNPVTSSENLVWKIRIVFNPWFFDLMENSYWWEF